MTTPYAEPFWTGRLPAAPVAQVVDPAAVDHPELIEYFARLGAERAENGRHSGPT